jgi:hypothetical protein
LPVRNNHPHAIENVRMSQSHEAIIITEWINILLHQLRVQPSMWIDDLQSWPIRRRPKDSATYVTSCGIAAKYQTNVLLQRRSIHHELLLFLRYDTLWYDTSWYVMIPKKYHGAIVPMDRVESSNQMKISGLSMSETNRWFIQTS